FRGAGAWLQQSAKDRQQRALAATGRTDNRHHLARAHGERHIVEHLERAEAMADMVGNQVHCVPCSAAAKSSLRAKRSNPYLSALRRGLLRRFAPRNDG